MALIDKLTAIANAIRGKTGKTAELTLDEMATEIANIETGTTPPTVAQAVPSISVSLQGEITAISEQAEGYVVGGTKKSTYQLSTQAGKTVTPGTTTQTAVITGKYTTAAVKVAGDKNLKAENIAKGVSIFGVTGSLASAKVATGTFTIPRVSSNRDCELIDLPQTITGLPFTPTRVIFFLDLGLGNHTDSGTIANIPAQWDASKILYGDTQSGSCFLTYHHEYEDEDGESYYDYGHEIVDSDAGFLFNITTDGFTIKASYANAYAATIVWCSGFKYNYIAIG